MISKEEEMNKKSSLRKQKKKEKRLRKPGNSRSGHVEQIELNRAYNGDRAEE